MLYRQCCRTGQLSVVLERWFLGTSALVPSRNYHLIQYPQGISDDGRQGRNIDSSGGHNNKCCDLHGSTITRPLSALASNNAQIRICDERLSLSRSSIIDVNSRWHHGRCMSMSMSTWSWSRQPGSRFSPLVCHLQKSSFFSGVPEKKKEFAERMIIGYSAEQMYSVVSDVENYKSFLPWCESSIVKTRRKDHILADLVIGMNPVTESYTSSVFLTKPTLIRAESTKGRFFNKMLTFWRFSAGLKGKPQSCVIDFYVSLEFRSAIHANLANVFFNEVVKAMTGAFYEEAKRRYGPASCPSRKISITKSSDDL